MNTQKPTIDDFKKQIESIFGKPLNSQAIEAAEDFWEHWESFYKHISTGDFNPLIDYFFLSYNFPEYKRYHPYKGAGKILVIIGMVTIFFTWAIGAAISVAGILIHVYGNNIKMQDGQRFYDDLMSEITINPVDHGYAKLCAYYIGGIVKLVTPKGGAVWPQYPSNAITGDNTFIESSKA